MTGTSWWDAVTVRLLTPLGMTRTTCHATEPYARGYVVHPWDGSLREEPVRTPVRWPQPASYGPQWTTWPGSGEILTVLRDPDGTVVALDIATFIFRRAPMHDDP